MVVTRQTFIFNGTEQIFIVSQPVKGATDVDAIAQIRFDNAWYEPHYTWYKREENFKPIAIFSTYKGDSIAIDPDTRVLKRHS